MTSDRIAAMRRGYDQCFGCGTGNPIGLGLDGFRRDDSKVTATFVPRPEFSGFAGVLHGGIVATALDEIMAWTAILVEDVMVVTGKLDLRYRKPATTTSEFVMTGEILRRRGRRLEIAGRMHADDTLVAEASGIFLAVEELEG
jgi:acyl-coenzyme A thioesterase PaaI-like protein